VPEESDGKAFFIKAYFDDLEQRIACLRELQAAGHENEALMLCCCYIEALGSQRYHQSNRKAKNYCTILVEYGDNALFGLVHPKQAVQVLRTVKLFVNNINAIEAAISTIGKQLCQAQSLLELLRPILTSKQKDWLDNNLYKLTIAAISYERVRSELVHDISAAPVSFSETTYNGNPIPSIDFDLLYVALQSVFAEAKRQSVDANKWYWEL